jgi:hypothetical protein
MRMLNHFLAGEDITDKETKSESGFVETKKLSFITLLIVASEEDDVIVGDKVKVPSNAGKQDELLGKEVKIIHRNDIIRIL